MSAFRVIRRFRDLLDVNWGTFADQDVAQYDSASGKLVGVPMSGGGGDLTDAVILAPAASTRNVIQPTAGTVIAAVVKAHAAQSVDLTQWQKSDATVLGLVNKDGHWHLTPTATYPAHGWGSLFVEPPNGFNFAATFKGYVDYINDGGDEVIYFDPTNTHVVLDYVNVTSVFPYGGFVVASDVAMARRHAFNTRVETSPGVFAHPTIIYTDGSSIFGKALVISLASVVADGELAASQIAPWFDGTNGAAKLMWKGKTANGTVVTFEQPSGIAYVAGSTDVAVADGGTGSSSAAGARTNLDVPSNAEAVLDTLFDANTILKADADNTPAALTMGASTILARLAAGNIKAASVAEILTLLDVPTNAEAILDTLVDAKGDLIVGTAADTVARVAVGSNGTQLRADSNLTEGIGFKNPIIPRSRWIPASGLIESVSRELVGSGALALTSGTLYLIALPTPLLAGVTYTSLSFISNGAATNPTNQWFCLVNKADSKTLRTTNDDTTTAWGSGTLKTLALSSTYTPTADIDAYIGIMVAATTPISTRVAASNTIQNYSPPLWSTANTGLTTALADGTTLGAFSAMSNSFWGAVS